MSSTEEDGPVVPEKNLASSVEIVAEIDDVMYANCRMEELPCFHDSITRNVAEVLLLKNAEEGSFLIRSSTVKDNYSVSVRMANSVKHFQIDYNGQWYSFGQAQFWTPFEIWTHLQNTPVLICDDGVEVHLTEPYLNELKSPIPVPDAKYCKITGHYLQGKPHPTTSTRRRSNIITSLEGALYKKKEGKNWKRRWCILQQNLLSYKKTGKEKKTIKTLDLSRALVVKEDCSDPSKKNCFRLIFPEKYYMFSSDSAELKDTWLKSIKWQIDASRPDLLTVPG